MRSPYRYPIGVFLAVLIILLYYNASYIIGISKHLTWPQHYPSIDGSPDTTSAAPSLLQPPPTDTTEEFSASTTSVSKVIVMAKLEKEDTSWVADNLPDWQTAIYTVDNPNATLHTDRNKGREANVYLTYIVQNYNSLPDIILFLHSHRDGPQAGWHTDAPGFDNVLSVRGLRLDSVQRDGYVNLRCLSEIGCSIVPFRDPPEQGRLFKEAYWSAWREMFQNENVPQEVGVACCSQFAVTRYQVLMRPKADYDRYLKWLLETELDDKVSGTILEYMWHIIYGRNPIHCPPIGECYCNVYGREC